MTQPTHLRTSHDVWSWSWQTGPVIPTTLQLDVESIRTVLATLDHGGMTRAAERLGLSQSAVSWKIKRLEQRVGRPLLVRDGHAVRPTRELRALLDDARAMVELHDRLAGRLRSSELSGTVRLGSNEEIDPVKMARLLGRFAQLHPGVRVEFEIDFTAALVPAVDRGDVDVAMVQVTAEELRTGDVALWTDRLRWATASDDRHLDVSPVPLVTFGERCFYRALSEPHLEAAGIEHTVAFAVSSTRAHRAAVVAGLGVAVMGERLLDDEVVAWPRERELPELPVVHQIVRTAPGVDDAALALVDALRAELLDPGRSLAAAV